MLRTDHIYPRTIMMPLEPTTPRDSDMGELTLTLPAPLPSGIEPMHPTEDRDAKWRAAMQDRANATFHKDYPPDSWDHIGHGPLAEAARGVTPPESPWVEPPRPRVPRQRTGLASLIWLAVAFALGWWLGGFLT